MNHPAGVEHVLVVSPADVAAGVSKTYDIMGNSAHNHTVMITAEMFVTLRAGTSIQTVSSQVVNGGASHTHTVAVICA